MVRLLIVTEIRLYREGLARVLAAEPRVQVVGTAPSMNEALRDLSARQPHVILLDAAGPAALDGVRVAAARFPEIQVVALGVADTESDVIACAEAGVAGFVVRDGSVEDLVAAIESAARGELRCSSRAAGVLMRRVARLAVDQRDDAVRYLTPRQTQILELVDQGLTNKEIAVTLRIEVATVKNHIHNLLEKLGAHRRGEAAAKVRSARRQRSRMPQDAASRS